MEPAGDGRGGADRSLLRGGWQAPEPPPSALRYTSYEFSTGRWKPPRWELCDEEGTTVVALGWRTVQVIGEVGRVYRASRTYNKWTDVGTGQIRLRKEGGWFGRERWVLADDTLSDHYSMDHKRRIRPKGDPDARGLLGFSDSGGNVLLTVRWTDLRMSTAEVIVYTTEQQDILLLAAFAVVLFKGRCTPPRAGA